MSKKGLSPVIASVLLVALVLVLAAIIYLWARTMIPETAEKLGGPIEDQCPNIVFVAEMSNDGSAIIIQNKGRVPIQGIRYAIGGAGSLEYEDIIHDAPVVSGGSSPFLLLGSVPGSGEDVRVIPILLGEDTSTSKRVPFPCEKSVIIIKA